MASMRASLSGGVGSSAIFRNVTLSTSLLTGKVLPTETLKVPVGIKEKQSPRPVCYCFGHTVESIREEIEQTGRSTVAAAVTERVKAMQCSCELLNPKGSCCLGDVNRIVNAAFASLRGHKIV